MNTVQSFARECVVLAAKESTTRYAREWFKRDESGTWEKEALLLMSRVTQFVWSPEFIKKNVAINLRLMACRALITKAKK